MWIMSAPIHSHSSTTTLTHRPPLSPYPQIESAIAITTRIIIIGLLIIIADNKMSSSLK